MIKSISLFPLGVRIDFKYSKTYKPQLGTSLALQLKALRLRMRKHPKDLRVSLGSL